MEDLAIDFIDINKDYPGVKALSNFSLKIKKGTIHGLLGPNGAGKSTSMKIAAGLVPASSGDVKICGVDVVQNPIEARALIGILPENPALYLNMTVKEYLRFVYDIHSLKDLSQTKSRVEEVLKKCSLENVSHRIIGNLSKGYKQRVGIAAALVYDAPVIILDEPTVGLDPNAIQEIRELVKSLKEHHTIVLSSHLLHEVSLVCDDVTIINEGQIIKTGSVQQIQKEFKKTFTLFAKIKDLSQDHVDQFIKDFPKVKAEFKSLDDCFELKINADDDSEREEWIKWLAANLRLLEFKEEEVSLEDIFKNLVKENQK